MKDHEWKINQSDVVVIHDGKKSHLVWSVKKLIQPKANKVQDATVK